jgi:hypothetical protein
MKLDQMTALEKLRYAERLIDDQSLARLPQSLQLELIEIQQALYVEIQALQAKPFKDRSQTYTVLSDRLAKSRSSFEAIESWAKSARRNGEIVSGLLKGLRTVLAFI